MRRLTILLLFVTPLTAQAGPLKKIAHAIANHVTLDVAAGGSSGFATGGTFYCRTHNPNVEGCTARYGSAAGVEIARGIFTGAMIAWSEYGHKQGFREWFNPRRGYRSGKHYLGN